jgi:hypothetical protein
LKTDPTNHAFNLESDEIEVKQSSAFIDFIRNQEDFHLSSQDEVAVLSICK